MTFYTRSDWGARPANGGPGNLSPVRVEGIAFHWPAMSKPLRGFDEVSAALRGWQDFHMDGRGWSDIAYQEAFDQEGNVYSLRGLTTQSGANGDTDVNQRFGAFLLILAPGEKPSGAMVRAVRDRVEAFRARYPRAKRLVGHGDIRPEPTSCPGPAAIRLIRKGAFEPKDVTRGRRVDNAIKWARAAKRKAKGLRDQIITDALDILRNIKPRRKGK